MRLFPLLIGVGLLKAQLLSANPLFIAPVKNRIPTPAPEAASGMEEMGPEKPTITPPAAQFMSTVQLAISERDPRLLRRSQQLVLEQINAGFQAWPELRHQSYDVRTQGNEVVLYLMTNDDMRAPMQQAVSSMIQNLNGRVRARGRTLFYRTSADRPVGGYLEVVVNDIHTKVKSIAAQSVPLRDVLKELKTRLGGMSYLIPGDCADRLVDWSFAEEKAAEGKPIDAVISELATLFEMRAEKKNGTYIFTGDCLSKPARKSFHNTDILTTTNFFPTPSLPEHHTQVYFPVVPLQ